MKIENSAQPRKCGFAVCVACRMVTLIALGVLAGWVLDSTILKAMLPGFVTMKTNTAVGLLLLSLAIPFLDSEAMTPRRRNFAVIAALLAFLLNLLTLGEYLMGWELRIDELLFRDSDTSLSNYPGRPSPVTCVDFLILSAAVMLMAFHHAPRIPQYAAALIATTSVIVVLGHFYGVDSLYAIGHYTAVAPHTTVAFLLLAFALLASRPSGGIVATILSASPGGFLARRLIPMSILIPITLGLLQMECERLGLFGNRFGHSLFTVSVILLFCGLTVWIAVRMERIDEARRLLEARLLQSQKMDAIGQLAGGVAHDFNNLLTVINGQSQLILEHLRPDDPLRKDVSLIFKTGERAAELTRQMLVFSRQEVLEYKLFDLNATVVQMDKMLRRLLRENIVVKTVLNPKIKHVRGAPGQLQQVLMNLVVNARDAMPNGGDLVIETNEVELDESYSRRHPDVAPGRYVMLAVSDSGTGIPESIRARIFEPFFTTKAQGKGTGLGLSTVYGILRQNHGHIEVYSELGQGTTFKVYLPEVDEVCDKAASSALLPAVQNGNEAILVVENEEAIRELVRDCLSSCGYTVYVANNGRDALSVFNSIVGKIDLVISDVIMPGMGGPEMARNLKVNNPQLKVLFVSGYTDQAITQNGTIPEKIPFLEKPFTPSALLQKIRETLDVKAAV